MHTFLTVTATGTKFTLTTAGRNHGDAYKRAVGVANGCNVKHEGMAPDTGAFDALAALKAA